jgi:hypothetical protein
MENCQKVKTFIIYVEIEDVLDQIILKPLLKKNIIKDGEI